MTTAGDGKLFLATMAPSELDLSLAVEPPSILVAARKISHVRLITQGICSHCGHCHQKLTDAAVVREEGA